MKNIDDILAKACGGHDTVATEWLPASGLHPILQKDSGLLWLKEYGQEEGFKPDTSRYALMPMLARLGHLFEATWVKKEAPEAVRAMEHDWQSRQVASLRRTLELMERKTPVIAKAALWWADKGSPDQGVFGSCDVICLTSWLYKKYSQLRPADYKTEPDHYVPLDLKYTTGLGTSDKREDYERYSCQMRIYAYALGHLQDYMPRRAFLIGRELDPVPVEVNQELGKPLDKTLRDYREQYKRIKLRGKRLKPWVDKEVAVNMGNKMDYPWHNAKEIIQTELVKGQSLTMLPGIGNKKADALEDLGYDCLADMLSVKPEDIPLEKVVGIGILMAARIRAVLRANRSKKATKVPAHVLPVKTRQEYYVDMEAFSNINCDMEALWPNIQGSEGVMCFMIGVGWEERGRWRYTQFVAESDDQKEAKNQKAERKVFRQFIQFLESRQALEPGRSTFFHYSNAEPTLVRQAIERHGGALKKLAALSWFDVLDKIMHAVPIGIPGAYKFDLKEVATALSAYSEEHRVTWPEGLSSGSAAQVAGWEAYQHKDPLKTTEMQLLTRYLESDCKALWSLLKWLRESAGEVKQPRKQAAGGGWYGVRISADVEKGAGWYSAYGRVDNGKGTAYRDK